MRALALLGLCCSLVTAQAIINGVPNQNLSGVPNAGFSLLVKSVAPTFGGTTTLDLSTGNIFNLGTLTGNTTIAVSNQPTNGGGPWYILACQDGTGGRTFTWPASFKDAPQLYPDINSCQAIGPIQYDGTANYYLPGTTVAGLVALGSTGSACGSNPASGNLCAWFDTTNGNLVVKDSSGAVYQPISLPASASLVKCTSPKTCAAASASDIAAVNYVVGGGTAQAQTATFTPAPSLSDGTRLCWQPAAANTAAAPTFSPNSLTAHAIVKTGGAALVANDLTTTAIACAIYHLSSTQWELQNPQTSSGGSSAFNAITSGTNSTATMTLGTGATMTFSGSGVNNANQFKGNATVAVADGGTGDMSLAAHGVVVGAGTSPANVTTPGTAGQCFVSNGATSDPTFQACPGASAPAGGGGGTSQSFSNATSVTVPGLGTKNVTLACFDTLGNNVDPSTWSVSGTAPYNVSVTFSATASGNCVITGMGKYTSTLQSGSTWTITAATSGFGTAGLTVTVYDNETPRKKIEPDSVTVDPSTFQVVVVFAAPQTGYVVIE